MNNQSLFLSPEEQVEYLYRKNYFAEGSFSEWDINRLGAMNFHYVLGV
ncbi:MULTISPECIES: hypothetical protein [unclassified Corynebacterium]|nr:MULTISPECIES: hypothetical protein [unclassified Corynebacterium]WPF66314.1 hypothetical protein OLX12_00865 [Corynebacterium sp. 22KM0430]WPF68804.1 hypothetical protein OLW90_00865 [Corynebacterium sp. 21KM1197]